MQENSENRLVLLGIIVSDGDAVERVNATLHDYAAYVVGRMGLPLRDRGVSAITLVFDAPADIANSLAGRLGKIGGVKVKALFG